MVLGFELTTTCAMLPFLKCLKPLWHGYYTKDVCMEVGGMFTLLPKYC
jgi:hypothetical protein